MTNSPRIVNIDIARGVASLGVCLVHIQLLTNFISGTFLDRVINNGQLGVQIFFIISGFVIPFSFYQSHYTIKDFPHVFLKRRIRIDPSYWIALLIMILLFTPVVQWSLANSIYNFFYLVPFIKSAHWIDSIYWTLGVEFQFFIIIGLAYPALMYLPVKYRTILIIIILQLLLFFPFHQERIFVVANLIFYLIGFLTFQLYAGLINYKAGLIILLLLCIEIGMQYAIRFGILTSFCALFILFPRIKEHAVFIFLNKISYALFLTHMFTGGLLLLILPNLNPAVLFIILFFCCICFAYVYYILVEKPLISILLRVLLKHPNGRR